MRSSATTRLVGTTIDSTSEHADAEGPSSSQMLGMTVNGEKGGVLHDASETLEQETASDN